MADMLYTCNFTFLGLHEAYATTGDPQYRQMADKLAEFFVRIQVRSEAHPELDPDRGDSQLASGQVKMTPISAQEPPGKPLEECQKVCVTLTLDGGCDNGEVRAREGIPGLGRSRLLRMTHPAWEQGGLLSYEDLALRLLECSVRTIIRDARVLRKRGLFVPARWQQKDMGPRQTHRLEAVRLFLKGQEFHEIARRRCGPIPMKKGSF